MAAHWFKTSRADGKKASCGGERTSYIGRLVKRLNLSEGMHLKSFQDAAISQSLENNGGLIQLFNN